MIIVPTIPHTGTHFMRYHLLENQECFVDHIWPAQIDRWLPLLENAESIIVPLREPWAVARSWASRAHLPSALQLEELSTWWRLLIEKVDALDPYYLPIDRPIIRDSCLGRINNDLGLELRTDWRIVRDADGTAGNTYETGVMGAKQWNRFVEPYESFLREHWTFFARWAYPWDLAIRKPG